MRDGKRKRKKESVPKGKELSLRTKTWIFFGRKKYKCDKFLLSD